MGKQKSDYSVLVVDDSEIITELISILLDPEGYQLGLVSSAEEAMILIKQQSFDLILMDIEMPEVTGVELLTDMKQQNMLQNTKVLMLTGQTDGEYVEQSMQLGAEGYILKPFDHDELKQRVWDVLQSV